MGRVVVVAGGEQVGAEGTWAHKAEKKKKAAGKGKGMCRQEGMGRLGAQKAGMEELMEACLSAKCRQVVEKGRKEEGYSKARVGGG